MARKVIWSYEAATDLEALADYVTRDSAFYASAFVEEIVTASRSLDEVSGRGRVVPELGNQSIREIFVKEYRLVYKIDTLNERVDILGLIHGKRDLKKLWEREEREN